MSRIEIEFEFNMVFCFSIRLAPYMFFSTQIYHQHIAQVLFCPLRFTINTLHESCNVLKVNPSGNSCNVLKVNPRGKKQHTVPNI